MTGFTKLFGSIVASTIWREPHETRIVWITMLALANKHGRVEASLPGLADLARVTIPECQSALAALEGPDEFSRTKEHDGRRVAPCDGGWLVLNYAKYREKMNADERREYLTAKQREHRAKKAVNTESTLVNKCSDPSTPSTHAEAEAEAEAGRKRPGWMPEGLRKSRAFLEAWGQWEEHCAEVRRPLAHQASYRQLAQCEKEGIERSIAVIRASIAKNSFATLYWDYDAGRNGDTSKKRYSGPNI